MNNWVKKVKVNDRFNRLIVKEIYITNKRGKTRRTYCICLCDCGNKIDTRADALQCGRTQSCGCLQREKARIQFIKEENRNYSQGSNVLYNNYRSRSKRKNIEFNLDRDIFQKLTQSNCFYCGREPSSISTYKKNKPNVSNYYYNGLDRINSNEGYVLNNVITSCQVCNIAKSTLTQIEFFDMITKIYENRYLNKGKNNE